MSFFGQLFLSANIIFKFNGVITKFGKDHGGKEITLVTRKIRRVKK